MKKQLLHVPSKLSRIYFRLSMLLTVTVSIVLLHSYLNARASDPVRANLVYPPLLEYIIASVTIAVGGVLLLELVLTDLTKRK